MNHFANGTFYTPLEFSKTKRTVLREVQGVLNHSAQGPFKYKQGGVQGVAYGPSLSLLNEKMC